MNRLCVKNDKSYKCANQSTHYQYCVSVFLCVISVMQYLRHMEMILKVIYFNSLCSSTLNWLPLMSWSSVQHTRLFSIIGFSLKFDECRIAGGYDLCNQALLCPGQIRSNCSGGNFSTIKERVNWTILIKILHLYVMTKIQDYWQNTIILNHNNISIYKNNLNFNKLNICRCFTGLLVNNDGN